MKVPFACGSCVSVVGRAAPPGNAGTVWDCHQCCGCLLLGTAARSDTWRAAARVIVATYAAGSMLLVRPESAVPAHAGDVQGDECDDHGSIEAAQQPQGSACNQHGRLPSSLLLPLPLPLTNHPHPILTSRVCKHSSAPDPATPVLPVLLPLSCPPCWASPHLKRALPPMSDCCTPAGAPGSARLGMPGRTPPALPQPPCGRLLKQASSDEP